jgi:hypothetical protein
VFSFLCAHFCNFWFLFHFVGLLFDVVSVYMIM